jgi:excisionase family DNA binding protein
MVKISGQEYLSTAEVAQRLGVRADSIRHWISDGRVQIPSQKIGSARLFRREDVEAFAATYRNPRAT